MSGTNLRFINTLILSLFVILALTGLYGLVWPFPSALFEIHRIAAWAFIGLAVLLVGTTRDWDASSGNLRTHGKGI